MCRVSLNHAQHAEPVTFFIAFSSDLLVIKITWLASVYSTHTHTVQLVNEHLSFIQKPDLNLRRLNYSAMPWSQDFTTTVLITDY